MLADWQFLKNEEKEAWRKDFNDSDWEKIQVPHDWGVAYPFERHYSSGTGYLTGGIGWYRTKLSLKELGAYQNKVIKVHFEGVYKRSRVWVNGYHMGMKESGYASFYYDITDLLRFAPDDELVISVRVEREDLADSRWYNGNGINRPVSIEIHESVYIDDYGTSFVTPSVHKEQSEIVVRHDLVNQSPQDQELQLVEELSSLQTNESIQFEETVLIKAGEKRTVELTATLNNPERWSPDQPNLYQLKTYIKKNDHIISTYTETVGFRTFSFTPDQGFYLNGDYMKIKGVCLHEDAGCFGTAVPVAIWASRLLKLKEMGTNAIRMAHNPHSFDLYRLCDSLGFLVFDEVFDEWENPKNKWWQGHNVYPPKLDGPAEHFSMTYEEDLKNMIMRNRNHPSIIAWSIGNEVDYPNDPYANPLFDEMTGNNDNSKPAAERQYNPHRPDTRRLTTIANRLIAITKECDPSRPVTLAAAFPELSTYTGLIDQLDVVGYNYKEHLYEEDHLRFPDKPFIGSENSHGFKEWQIANNLAYISGQFLWTGIDYLGEAHGWPIHGSGAGLLTLANIEKSTYYKRKSWWTNEPTVYLTTRPYQENSDYPEWEPTYRKWDYLENEKVEVRCYSNAHAVTLIVGDQSVETSYNEQFGYYQAIITYKQLPLVAEASFGTAIQSDTLLPSTGPAALLLKEVTIPKTVQATIQASGLSLEENLHQIEVTVIDSNHQPTLAELMVHIAVEHGQLVGIENGDLADTTAYSEAYRRTYQGKLMCYIRSTDILPPIVTMQAASLAGQTFVVADSKEAL